MQGFTQGMQHTQKVANDMVGICHVMWLVSNYNILFLLRGMFWTLCCLHKPCLYSVVCIACMRLETVLYAV